MLNASIARFLTRRAASRSHDVRSQERLRKSPMCGIILDCAIQWEVG